MGGVSFGGDRVISLAVEGKVPGGLSIERCLQESWLLKTEREGKGGGSQAAAGLAVGGVQAI